MQIKKQFVILVLAVFLLAFAPLTSAADWDNKLNYNQDIKTITIQNTFGLGRNLIKAQLTDNFCKEGRWCEADKIIELFEEGALIEDFKTLRLDDFSKEEQNIRWYKLEYFGTIDDFKTQCTYKNTTSKNETYVEPICKQIKIGEHEDWIQFKEGDVFPKGIYQVRTTGEIKPGRVYDWQIKIEGKWTTPWATWGNISEGDDAEVILNSPADNSIIYNSLVTFNATANVTGGATLNNMSLWTNESGNWKRENIRTGEIKNFENWTSYPTIVSGLPDVGTSPAPTVFDLGDTTYLISGEADGNYYGFKWTGLSWTSYPTIVSGLGNVGNVGNPTVFDLGDTTYLISGEASGNYYGFKWTGLSWTSYPTIVSGLPDVGSNSDPTVFDLGDTTYLISGTYSGGYYGFKWTGLSWTSYPTIVSGLGNVGIEPSPTVFDLGDTTYLISGEASGNYYGFKWTGLSWTSYPTIVSGLGNVGIEPSPTVFDLGDTTYLISGTYYGGWNGFKGNIKPISTLNKIFFKTIINMISWNIQACDSDGDCGFAQNNFTVSPDSTAPNIIVSYPTGILDYKKYGSSLDLNWTVIDDGNLDSCWYNYNNTNTTVVCGDNHTTLNLSTDKSLTFYANDSFNNLASEVVSWDYKIFENSRTLNNSSYETQSEIFQINVSANDTLTEVALDYNGTEYPTTKEGTVYSKTLDIPLGVQNRSIRWKFTYSGDTIYSDYSYQNISEAVWTICNASYTDDFLNIRFKDESTLSYINGTIQTSTFTYYLGSGSVAKTYTYTDSGNSSNYKFCATPDKTFYVDSYINYLGDDYPNRIWEPTLETYNSNVTEKDLYLLSSTDGIYVTFVTATSFNTAIAGVDILINRDIAGEKTIVSQGITDSAGSFTAWINPNYDHIITASKIGYTTNTQTIRPTQTSYTLVMSTGVDEYTYVSDYEGLKWFVFPGVGVRTSDNLTNYGFNITAKNGNLINCKIELLNQDKTILLASAISSSVNGSSCEVQVAHSMSSLYPKVKGRLLVDLGNGYQLLEDDAYWAYLTFDSTGMTISDWFKGLKTGDLNYFNNDDQHREYTYILIFFLIVMIVCAVLNISGWDIQNPGGMVFLVGTLVWIASIPGFLTLNYISPFGWIDKFFIAGVYSLFMIGYATRNLT